MLSSIYKFLASRITSLGLLRSALLLTESLLVVGDDSTMHISGSLRWIVLVDVTMLKYSFHSDCTLECK